MEYLTLRPADACRWDLIALGEVMLRLDPGDGRISTTRTFTAWEGGGEYNVARGLKRCFGQRTAVVTKLVDNPVGRLIQDLMYQGGVDQSYVGWVADDGVGRAVRNGLNFTERGFGVRAALGCSDRGHTAISQMGPGDFDWETPFGKEGARWFHTGGIFAAIGSETPQVAIEAIKLARSNGTIVSYDLNYRPSLWKTNGGTARAQEVNRELVGLVDILFGNEEDFTMSLGFEVDGGQDHLDLNIDSYRTMIDKVFAVYPNLKGIATTLRVAKTASKNDWGAIFVTREQFHQAPWRHDLEIFDRVGGGDSFAAGLIYGHLAGKGGQWSVECGAAHGALAMTTPGDTTMASLSEVEKSMKMGSARVER